MYHTRLEEEYHCNWEYQSLLVKSRDNAWASGIFKICSFNLSLIPKPPYVQDGPNYTLCTTSRRYPKEEEEATYCTRR